jgi:hypothetical protein
MNLYKIFDLNRHNQVIAKRTRLFREISGKPQLEDAQLKEILGNEGFKVPSDFGYNLVTETTRKAFAAVSLDDKIKTLRKMREIGFAQATAVLSYNNPFKYARASERAYEQLSKEFKLPERDPKSEFNVREYEAYLGALKAVADRAGLKLPDAEYILSLVAEGKATLE